MIPANDSIDWMNAARVAPQFATAMVTVGALGAIVTLPPLSQWRTASWATSALRHIAAFGALASMLELSTYRYPEALAQAAPSALARQSVTPIRAIPTPAGETRIRLAAVGLTLAAFVLLATLPRLPTVIRHLIVALAWIGSLADIALAAVRAMQTGHWRWLLHPLHLLAAGLWVGTLTVMFVVLGWRRWSSGVPREFVAETIWRFSPLALGSAAILALTGTASAAPRVGSAADLWMTNYGRVLLIKLALVGVVAACGAWNKRHLRASLAKGSRESWRTARIELGASVAVVAAAAILVSVTTTR